MDDVTIVNIGGDLFVFRVGLDTSPGLARGEKLVDNSEGIAKKTKDVLSPFLRQIVNEKLKVWPKIYYNKTHKSKRVDRASVKKKKNVCKQPKVVRLSHASTNQRPRSINETNHPPTWKKAHHTFPDASDIARRISLGTYRGARTIEPPHSMHKELGATHLDGRVCE